jgi:hypothetical protein
MNQIGNQLGCGRATPFVASMNRVDIRVVAHPAAHLERLARWK